MADYPTGREPFFAHKLVRRMGRVCAALEMGIDACWLVSLIAHTEDAKRYSGPVGWWNPSLQDIAGFGSWDKLDRARKRAVAAGWLHYESGGKHKIGKYWTMVPPQYADIPDGAFDDSKAISIRTSAEETTEQSADQSLIEPGSNLDQSSKHSSLPLFPDPPPSPEKKPVVVSCKDIPIPGVLDTPPFRDAWKSWLTFRREHKYSLLPSAVKGQLTVLRKMGSVQAAIDSIEYSIAGAYKGLFKQNENRSYGKPKPPSATGHDPDHPVTPI